MKPQPVHLGTPLDDHTEEIQRAEIYGLLAALFIAPPSAELLGQMQVAPTEAPSAGGFLETSWGELVAAARRTSAASAAVEYDALFQGIGKPEIFLYASYHKAGAINDQPLVALRDDLAALGLARETAVSETEDHIAFLCEVMRYLIAGDDPVAGSLPSQKRFHAAHIAGWVDAFCDQIATHPKADFYRAVALFAHDFFAVEQQGFDLLDA
ncbi:TorD/DmsD family molecular chaperone [Caldimonas sp. KR1-144]|uniref:TorD/DmsD family molecular chaperone n=1 Tax=Caldimonas sp. KR1-144 TaxID=3400911 RepID=UPI003C0057AF